MEEKIEEWKNTVLVNFQKKKEISHSEIDHILDWMQSPEAKKYINRLYRISVPAALSHANRWTERLNKKAAKLLNNDRDKEGLKIIKKFKDFNIVELKSEEAYAKEGQSMGHCVYSYYGQAAVIFSLRDKDNQPHCTIEYHPQSKEIYQIKGKQNKAVHPKYHQYIIDFLNDKIVIDWETISLHDIENIGASSFGNLLFKEIPENVIFDGDLFVHNQRWNSLFNNLTIKGDVELKNITQCRKLAKNIIIEGDLIIQDAHHMLRLCDQIEVKGDIEITDCPNLKCLAKNELFQGDVYLCDLDEYRKKVISSGTVEIQGVPFLRK